MFRRAFALATILAVSCDDDKEEVFPNEPQITFESIRFVSGGSGVNGITVLDTVVFSFQITDGDENFGLDYLNPAHSIDPFQNGFFVNKSTGALVSITKILEVDRSTLLSYGDRVSPPA